MNVTESFRIIAKTNCRFASSNVFSDPVVLEHPFTVLFSPLQKQLTPFTNSKRAFKSILKALSANTNSRNPHNNSSRSEQANTCRCRPGWLKPQNSQGAVNMVRFPDIGCRMQRVCACKRHRSASARDSLVP